MAQLVAPLVSIHVVGLPDPWEYQITGVSKENTYRPVFEIKIKIKVFEFRVSPPITSEVRSD